MCSAACVAHLNSGDWHGHDKNSLEIKQKLNNKKTELNWTEWIEQSQQNQPISAKRLGPDLSRFHSPTVKKNRPLAGGLDAVGSCLAPGLCPTCCPILPESHLQKGSSSGLQHVTHVPCQETQCDRNTRISEGFSLFHCHFSAFWLNQRSNLTFLSGSTCHKLRFCLTNCIVQANFLASFEFGRFLSILRSWVDLF